MAIDPALNALGPAGRAGAGLMRRAEPSLQRRLLSVFARLVEVRGSSSAQCTLAAGESRRRR